LVNMDTHYSPCGSNSLDDDQLNEDMGDDATNILGSSVSASSKKRGPSIGIKEIEGQPRLKLAMSARNKLNREQQIMLSSLGRTSVAIARDKLALEKGIPESKITRADSYMLIHKPKETNSIKNHISEHPESQYDLSGDAIATVVGPDKIGRFQGLGIGVCKIVLRKGDSLMKKNDGLMEANTLLERKIETMEANMDAKMSRHMEEVRGLFMSQRGTFNDNVPSPHSHANHHSTAPLENAYYIGKDCELRGGWPLELVARGIVQDVDPNTEYGERTLEEGNFKVYVQVLHRADAILPFPHNVWQRTLVKLCKELSSGLKSSWCLHLAVRLLEVFI
ncbi:hypothetical protein IFM89_003286, partial [Coptis chinensis]